VIFDLTKKQNYPFLVPNKENFLELNNRPGTIIRQTRVASTYSVRRKLGPSHYIRIQWHNFESPKKVRSNNPSALFLFLLNKQDSEVLTNVPAISRNSVFLHCLEFREIAAAIT